MWRIAATAVLIICSSAACAARSRTITADVAARAFNALHLNVNIGGVTIGASRDNAVHIKVTITPKQHGFLGLFHWSDSNAGTSLANIKLNRSRDAHALALSLTYPSGFDQSDVKTQWHIGMPARQHFKGQVHVGELALSGIAGGVDLKVHVGKVNIKIPRGVIHADVNVGDIDAVTATRNRGAISLASNVGSASLHMQNAPRGKSGHRSGVGESVHVPGKGRDDMKLQVNVGKVDLTIKKPRR